jgi:hypothetical protein
MDWFSFVAGGLTAVVAVIVAILLYTWLDERDMHERTKGQGTRAKTWQDAVDAARER